jgi:hypothetical protein
MTATNKRYSYPIVAVIRIDVHPAGENPIDSHRVSDSTSPVVRIGNLLLVPTRTKHTPTLREALTTEDRLVQSSSWVTSFPLPHDSLWVGERGFSQVVSQLHQLTEPISPACNRYIQYLLVGDNSLALNRHKRGLQPWRCRLSTCHSSTFPTDGPPLFT